MLLAWGCAGVPLGLPRVADCAGPLPDTAEIPGGDFVLRERIRVEAPGIELALELLTERRGDRLVLVGFDAFGARALSVVQTGRSLDSDARFGRALPIDPESLLRDVHAAGRLDADAPARDAVRRDGCEHTTRFVRLERRALP
jgi:hypothetical protein